MATTEPQVDGGLREERDALNKAQQLRALLGRGDAAAIRAALDSLLAYMCIELEAHFAEEESFVFPRLWCRGLQAEVRRATVQHDELRALRAELESKRDGDMTTLRTLLARLANELAQHVRFEADFLYVDVTGAELADFRAELDAFFEQQRRKAATEATAAG